MGENTVATSSLPSSAKMAEERNAVSGTTTVSPSEYLPPACCKTVPAIKDEHKDKNDAPKNTPRNTVAPSGPPSIAKTTTKIDGHDIKDSTSRCSIKNPCPFSPAKTTEKHTAIYSPPTTSPSDNHLPKEDDMQNMGRSNPTHCCEGISNSICAEDNVLDSSTELPTSIDPPKYVKTNIYDSQGNIDYVIIHCSLSSLKQFAHSVIQIIVEHPWDNLSCHERDWHHNWLVDQFEAVKRARLGWIEGRKMRIQLTPYK